MFDKLKSIFKVKEKVKSPLEQRIDELTEHMKHFDEDSEAYSKMAENLAILVEANAKTKETAKKWHLDSNVLFNGIVACLQIVVILIWEERHVIRSVALKNVTKLIGKK